MARLWYGGAAADFAIGQGAEAPIYALDPNPPNDPIPTLDLGSSVLLPLAASNFDVYTDAELTSQTADLLDGSNSPITQVVAEADFAKRGTITRFQGPDGHTGPLWLSSDGVVGFRLEPESGTLYLRMGTAEDQIEVLEANTAVLGSLQVKTMAERLTNLTLTAAFQDVVSLPPITFDGTTPWKLGISWWGINPAGGAAMTVKLAIREGSTVIDEVRVTATASNTSAGGSREIVFTPPAGSHTYKFSAVNETGSGSPVLEASATHRAQITAEANLYSPEDADITNIDARLDALEAVDTSLDTRLDAREAADVAFDTRVTEVEDTTTAVELRVTTLEDDSPSNYQPVISYSSTTQAVTTATPSPGSPVISHVFVAPPSGRVWISITGFLEGAIDGNSCIMGWELRAGGTVGAGTVIEAINDDWCLITSTYVATSRPNRQSGSSRHLQIGLTPGATYNVRTLHYSTPAGSGSVYGRELTVEHVL